jgi:predicted alpha-1,2-mannosidase
MQTDLSRRNQSPRTAAANAIRGPWLAAAAMLIAVLAVSLAAQTADYAKWVNPFIGTGGHGHTFPGATVPFGMVQLSPDTRIDNWDGSSGYHYSDDVIYGFSHTHLSGTGIPDGCDILLMPASLNSIGGANAGSAEKNGYASKFFHSTEKAEPGYYSVLLDDDQIQAEMTATARVGLHRYTFPKNQNYRIVMDLGWRDRVTDSELRMVGSNRVEGFRESASWAKNQKVYFVAEFAKPLQDFSSTENFVGGRLKGKNLVLDLNFNLRAGEQMLVKVAISHVSIEGARKNLEAELPHWDFDRVRREARAAWNKELSKIEVSGGTPEQTTNFYTALYHTMIHPNVFNDVDGRYKGHDGKVHSLREEGQGTRGKGKQRGDHYTVFSLWDTFRAAHPLYTIIDQKRTADYINSFIRMYEQGGRLPVWELWGEETDTMIGYHAVSVISDAMAKGIKGFDYDKAYAAAKHSAELDHFGLAAYKKRGYISSEDENESVSKTLEYAYNDWCLMKMGSLLYNMRALGRQGARTAADEAYLKMLSEEVDRYRRRSGNFENLFDKETGFFRPKRNGGFIKPFAPQEVTFHFTEGNSWQYSFFVPHDIDRLMQLLGGARNFERKLDELFTTDAKLSGRFQPDITGLMGQYAHGNEPSHHIAYLYSYAGVPHKTQERVRRIMDDFYKPTPDGLIGNEDCGQMSAWYVLSASGFYPVAPGDERYALGSPIFKEVKYNLESGRKFIVRAPKVSPQNFYIKSARWNGDRHTNAYIDQYLIDAGGVLELEMSDKPSPAAFDTFPSSSVFRDQPAVPVIEGERVFVNEMKVTLATSNPRDRIIWTTDATQPASRWNTYAGPITVNDSVLLTAQTVGTGGVASLPAEARFIKRANDWSAKVTSGYSPQYNGGGDDAIVDGLRGNTNFASGEWQGIQGKRYEAVVDLRRETKVTEVGAGFLQHAGVWIWMPQRIEFEVSNNGTDWERVAEISTSFSLQEMKPSTRDFAQKISPLTTRFVRVRAENIGKIPAWHPGAGGEAWIFIDEVIIR